MLIYYIRLIIVAIIMFVFKINKEETITKKKRFLAIMCLILMIPIEAFPQGYKYMTLINPGVFMGIVIVLYGIYLKIYVKVRNKSCEIETYEDLDTLHREVEFVYNPSIVGYLMNQELELRDVSADILNLYAKKIINIKKDKENNYIIEYGEKYKKYEEKLNVGDKYIVETLLKKSVKFDFLEWKHNIKDEYEMLCLSKSKEEMSNKMFFSIIISIVIIGVTTCKIAFNSIMFGIIFSLLISLAFVLGYSVIYQNSENKHLKLTSIGEKEIKKCIKLKRFMEEYTLLENRKPEEILIYESYIPYAIALGVNKKYYGTIYEIFGEEEMKKIIEDIDVVEYYYG